MQSMSETDGIGVAVTGTNDEMRIFIGTFDALGKRKLTAVRGVCTVAVLVSADTGGAADARNQGDVFIFPSFLGTYCGYGILDTEVPAAGAPVRYNRIFIISR